MDIKLINEPCYTFGSADNAKRYPIELDLCNGYSPSSIHGLIIDGSPVVIIASADGGTGVHEHSLLQLGDLCFIAAGPNIVCIRLSSMEHFWTLKADEATCFGVHYCQHKDALISHGELSIARFTSNGSILWSTDGADIFSEGFELHKEHIEAIDFNGRAYWIDYDTGRENSKRA